MKTLALLAAALLSGCLGPVPDRCPYRLLLRCGGECTEVNRAPDHVCECPSSCSCWKRFEHPRPPRATPGR